MQKYAEYIRQIEIDSLWSGRKHVLWNLDRRVNILSGVNGVGKSTIINKVVKGLSAGGEFPSHMLKGVRLSVVPEDAKWIRFDIIRSFDNPVVNQELLSKVGISLYDNFYVEEPFDNGTTLRIFQTRQQVNTPCLMSGSLPIGTEQIAIDRMYAENNGLAVGDRLTCGDRSWIVSGLIALPDYSALFQDNNDTMFDSLQFGVAIVPEESFAQFSEDRLL